MRLGIVLARRCFAATVVALMVFGTAARAAGGPETAAEESVRRLAAQIVGLLSSDRLDEDRDRRELARVIDEEADLALLGRLVLGRHWRTMDERQREEYQRLFRELMLSKFVGHLSAYTGRRLGPPEEVFAVTGSQRVNEQDIIVSSEVRAPDRPALDVRWRLRGDGDPTIIDVVVEDVSLLISQRSEFSAVIERQGLDGLLAEMGARLQRSGRAQEASAASGASD